MFNLTDESEFPNPLKKDEIVSVDSRIACPGKYILGGFANCIMNDNASIARIPEKGDTTVKFD